MVLDEAEKSPGDQRDPVFSLYISQPESVVDRHLNEQNDPVTAGSVSNFPDTAGSPGNGNAISCVTAFSSRGGVP